MTQSGPTYRRWHDRHPDMAKAVELLCNLPYELQSVVGQAICQLAEQRYGADQMIRSLKSLGKNKIMGLYKSLRKKRAYDKNPELRQAMSYLYILNEEHQDEVAGQMMELIHEIFDYLTTCEQYHQPPTADYIALITELYTNEGLSSVKAFQDQYREKLLLPSTPQAAQVG
jgi:hypothetical protein